MKIADRILIFGIFLLTFALYCTTDIYAAFTPSLIRQFDTDGRLLKFTFLIGPLVAIVLSHSIGFWFKHLSYRFLYLYTVCVFCLGCWISCYSQLFSFFIYGRVIQALSLTGLGIINSSLFASILEGQKEMLGTVFQYYSGIFAFIFLASPLLGSVIHAQLGFEYCFYIPILLSLLSLGLVLLVLPKELSRISSSGPTSLPGFSKMRLIDKNLFFAAFPSSVTFNFAVHAPFFLAQQGHFSSRAIAVILILPLLCQLLASALKKSFGVWPLYMGSLLLVYGTFGPLSLRPFCVVFSFCIYPFYFVPLMARATASYLQTTSKIEASAHLNFCRNLFISVSMVVSTLVI